MEKDLKNVLVVGYYGHFNAGDEAILAGIVRQLKELPNVRVTVVSGRPEETARTYGVASVAADDLTAQVRAVQGCNLMILGGGGIIHDYWEIREEGLLAPNTGGLAFYLGFLLMAKLTGKPSVVHAVGVGPLKTQVGQRMVRIALGLAARISVRDAASRKLLADIGVKTDEVTVTADPAFALRSSPDDDRMEGLLRSCGVRDGEPLYAACFRYWDFGINPRQWELQVAQALDRFLEERDGVFLFLPFHLERGTVYGDDLEVSQRIRQLMQATGRVRILDQWLPPEELAWILGRSHVVLAMRLHAAIFAIEQSTPVVGMAYDPKLKPMFQEAGLSEDLLMPEEWTVASVHDALVRVLNRGAVPQAEVFCSDRRKEAQHELAGLLGSVSTSIARVTEWEQLLHRITLLRAIETDRLTKRTEELQDRIHNLKVAHDDAEEKWRQRLTAEVDGLEDRFRRERAAMSAEIRALNGRLDLLESSLALTLVYRLWNLLTRLFPVGTRRQRIYVWLRSVGEGLISFRRSRREQLPASALAVASEKEGGDAPAARVGRMESELALALQSFEERFVSRSESLFLIVSGTRLAESEGQRPMQLAREFSERGLPVIFAYWRWNRSEGIEQDRLDDGILQLPFDIVVEHPRLLTGLSTSRKMLRLALFEFPHPSLFRLVAELNASGWLTVYDVIDDWKEFQSVGQATWYDEEFERHLINATDAVVAVSEPLANRVRELGGSRVELLPNGLRKGLETIREDVVLERGEITVGYFGYLASAWFDWELVAETARRQPSWRIYLIGYGGSPDFVQLPENVVLLGKKLQTELSAYAANWDVAVVPFKPSPLAAGADPIKTYEYLAMGLPVVATGVGPPPAGDGFVRCVTGAEDFVAAITAAAEEGTEKFAARREFAMAATWGNRVEELLALVSDRRQRVEEKTELFRKAH